MASSSNLETRKTPDSAASEPQVFISYDPGDQRWHEQIAARLRTSRMLVLHSSTASPAPGYSGAVSGAIEGSQVILLLVSNRYLQSDIVHKYELPYIRSRVGSGRARIIYVVLEPCPWRAALASPAVPSVVVPKEDRALSQDDPKQLEDDLNDLEREVRRALEAEDKSQRNEATAEGEKSRAPKESASSGSSRQNEPDSVNKEKSLERNEDGELMSLQALERFQFSRTAEDVLKRAREIASGQKTSAHPVTPSTLFFAMVEIGTGSKVSTTPQFLSWWFDSLPAQKTAYESVFTQYLSETRDVNVRAGFMTANVLPAIERATEIARQTTGSTEIHARHLLAALLAAPPDQWGTRMRRRLLGGGVDVSRLQRDFLAFLRSDPGNDMTVWMAVFGEDPSQTAYWITQETFDRFSKDAVLLLSRANQLRRGKGKFIHISNLLHAFRENEANGTSSGRIADFLKTHDQDIDAVLGDTPVPEIRKAVPLSLTAPPSMSPSVRAALLNAIDKAGKDVPIEDSHILFGVLSTVQSARVVELNKRGMTPDKVPLPIVWGELGPSTHVARDRWTTEDSLGHFPYAYAIYRFLTDTATQPPLAISIQAPWGGGKSSLMRMIQSQLDPDAVRQAEQMSTRGYEESKKATVKDVLCELENASTENATKNEAKDLGQQDKKRFEVPAIQGGDRRRVTIWFNAWKYDSTSQVWAGLADCIVQQIGERLGPVERELFWFRLQLRRINSEKIRHKIYEEVFSKFLGKVMPWLWLYVAGIASFLITMIFAVVKGSFWVGSTSATALISTEILGAWRQFKSAKKEVEEKPARTSLGDVVQAPDYRANLGFVHEVVEDLKRVFETIPAKHLPMVVFIDDLDRCSPGKVAEVVEAINLFLAGEFPHCMFILGIDDEMVAAALDKAHGDVIAKLPGYAKSTSIGWRFMDKFVQLPFIVPVSSADDLNQYTESLLSLDGDRSEIDIGIRDRAAQVVEQAAEQETPPPEKVVEEIAVQEPLTNNQKETLKKDVEIIQEMSRNISKFSDQEQKIRELILANAKEYSTNPRDLKRFVNLFRFYYFLRAAREGRKEKVPSLEQMCRWIVLSLRWPEVVRWLRHPARKRSSECSSLAALENVGVASGDLTQWQEQAEKQLGLKPIEASWLSDDGLFRFFKSEASKFKEHERLSACVGMGLW